MHMWAIAIQYDYRAMLLCTATERGRPILLPRHVVYASISARKFATVIHTDKTRQRRHRAQDKASMPLEKITKKILTTASGPVRSAFQTEIAVIFALYVQVICDAIWMNYRSVYNDVTLSVIPAYLLTHRLSMLFALAMRLKLGHSFDSSSNLIPSNRI